MAKTKKRAAAKTDAAADSYAAEPEKATTESTDDGHAEAIKQYERGFAKERKNIELAYEDLRFLAEDGQWDEQAKRERIAEGRPVLIVNKMPQFVRQVTGDIRQSKPAIKVLPIDDRASAEVADKTLPAVIRYIEKRSDAEASYFAAADQAVAAGIGHVRVLVEYAGQDTFNRELRIEQIEDGLAVIWDPDSILPDRSDAKFCFVPVDMSRASFEKKYPDKKIGDMPSVSTALQGWFTDDHVRVCEYWYKEPTQRTLAQFHDGSVVDVTDDEEALAEAEMYGAEIEEREGEKVCRRLMTAVEFLDEKVEWPSADIPIVPMDGEVIRIGREIIRRGVIRCLKDVQRCYNYAFSTETEVVALQPKAPFLGTKKNFENHRPEWENANAENLPYLEYDPDPLNGGQAPQRVQPPVGSSGITELKATASSDMNAVTGIYPSSLGGQSNETSGKAILARQREGDTGTYVYMNNFGRMVRRVGKILLGLIPHVYDTQRTLRIVGDDGKIDAVNLNNLQGQDLHGNDVFEHDVTVGSYDLVVEMGPNFATRREEARDGMQSFMQAVGPQGAVLFADILAKQQEWPLADKVADRLKAMLPPQIQQAEAEEAGEGPGGQPAGPPQPSPEQMMQMQQQQQQMQMQQAQHQAQMQAMQAETQATMAGAQAKMAQAQAAIEKAESDREIASIRVQEARLELQAKQVLLAHDVHGVHREDAERAQDREREQAERDEDRQRDAMLHERDVEDMPADA